MGNVLKGINNVIDVTSKLATIGVAAAIAKPYIVPTVSEWVAHGKYKLAYRAHQEYAVPCEALLTKLSAKLSTKDADFNKTNQEVQSYIDKSNRDDKEYSNTLYQYLHITSQLLLDVDAIADDIVLCSQFYASNGDNDQLSWPSRFLSKIYADTASELIQESGNPLLVKTENMVVHLSNVYSESLPDDNDERTAKQNHMASQLNAKLAIQPNNNLKAILQYAKRYASIQNKADLDKLNITIEDEYCPPRMTINDIPLP